MTNNEDLHGFVPF